MCVCFFSLFAQLCVLFNHWAMAHRMDDIQTGLKEERVQPKKSDTFFFLFLVEKDTAFMGLTKDSQADDARIGRGVSASHEWLQYQGRKGRICEVK